MVLCISQAVLNAEAYAIVYLLLFAAILLSTAVENRCCQVTIYDFNPLTHCEQWEMWRTGRVYGVDIGLEAVLVLCKTLPMKRHLLE